MDTRNPLYYSNCFNKGFREHPALLLSEMIAFQLPFEINGNPSAFSRFIRAPWVQPYGLLFDL